MASAEDLDVDIDHSWDYIMYKVEPLKLPHNAKEISILLGDGGDAYKNIRKTGAKLKAGKVSEVTEGMLNGVAQWLHALYGLELLHPRYKNISRIDLALKVVINYFSGEDYHNYSKVATVVLDQLEEANWGEEVVEAEDAAIAGSTAVVSALPVASNSNGASTIIQAADNDPIFGAGQIMHHIDINQGNSKKSYRISEEYNKPSANNFGHNGIEVGTVWPLQIAAFRDGAHGRTMAGIAGTTREGCYSIVVSGKYDSIDKDLGHRIYYSDAGALTNTSNQPRITTGTDALRRSIFTAQPVRVLRSKGGKWSGSPSAGLRYDGLYQVRMETLKTNKLGGKYVQFHLTRCPGQDDIMVDRPDPDLVEQIKRVKRGITRRL